jgi:hypothetical protein
VTAASENDSNDLAGNFQTHRAGEGSTAKSWSLKGLGERLKALSFEGAGGKSTEGAVGATLMAYRYADTVAAQIEDGVVLFADTLGGGRQRRPRGHQGVRRNGPKFGFTGVGAYIVVTTTPRHRRRRDHLGRRGRHDPRPTPPPRHDRRLLMRSERIDRPRSPGTISRDHGVHRQPAAERSRRAGGASTRTAAQGSRRRTMVSSAGSRSPAPAPTPKSDQETAAAVAMGLARNVVADTAAAYNRHATVTTSGGDVELKATNEAVVDAFSIGVGIARGNVNSVAIAGAAATNTVDNDTKAFIQHGTIWSSGAVRVTASTFLGVRAGRRVHARLDERHVRHPERVDRRLAA